MDAFMIFLIMLSFNIFLSEKKRFPLSAVVFALATLTKGLPILIAPLWIRKWRGKGLLIYLLLMISFTALFAQSAGWGLERVMDGRGFFGAFRIFARYWQFNAPPIYQAFDQWSNPAGVILRILAILIVTGVTILCARLAWKYLQFQPLNIISKQAILRLSVLPLCTYILLSPTLHPWYLIFNSTVVSFFHSG